MASVNPELPTACQELTNFLNGRHQLGPRAIVDLRNSLVHPQSESTASDGAYNEAAQLALRYVELLLLRHIGYEGEYIDRIAAHFEGHVRPEPVPWQAFDTQCDDVHVTGQAWLLGSDDTGQITLDVMRTFSLL